MVIREAKSEDIDLLWQSLAIAAYEPDIQVAKNTPMIALHLTGWRRDCDFGYIATGNNGAFWGAAWARQFSACENPAFFHNEVTPEVSIGVVDQMRGRGVGGALLARLVAEAESRRQALCLNVREGNRAIENYLRCGFRPVRGAKIVNRIGGCSIGMIYCPSSMSQLPILDLRRSS